MSTEDSPDQMKQSMDDYIRWIIGEDEFDAQEFAETENGSFVPFQVRNLLRKEQRERAGL